MRSKAERRFIKVNLLAIIFLFLVIIAGGVVRSTGAGMGCPDWPKCFNRLIPPTSISQLPEDYEQHYVEGRVKKNERFANVLERLGYTDLATKLRNDKSILKHEDFNALKTWTEYANRLVGALSGVFLLLCVAFSFSYLGKKSAIFVLSVLNLFTVVFQAWLGSIVVSTNLTPWVITIHMLLAIVIVCISIYTYYLATRNPNGSPLVSDSIKLKIKTLCILSLLTMTYQVILGTEVREEVDMLNGSGIARADFLEKIGSTFTVHRIVSYCSLILVVILFFLVRRNFNVKSKQLKFASISMILVGIQMLSGIILARFALPAIAQTTHLVVATLLFGAQFYLMLLFGKSRN